MKRGEAESRGDEAVRAGRLARALPGLRAARDGRAGPGRGLEFTAHTGAFTGGVAADVLGAAHAAGALVRRGAGRPGGFLALAGAGSVAVVSGDAIGVGRAHALARRAAADVGIAGLHRRGPAAPGTIAGRGAG